MQFDRFPQANDVLKAAPGTESYVQDLFIFRHLPYVVSCVSFDAEELAHIVATGRVYLLVDGDIATTADQYMACYQRFALLADFYDAPTAETTLVSFPGANAGEFLFMQPLPGQQLPADSHPAAVACFEFTEAQIKHISATGKVYVKAMGTTHPPIRPCAENPIVFSAPVEPQAEPA